MGASTLHPKCSGMSPQCGAPRSRQVGMLAMPDMRGTCTPIHDEGPCTIEIGDCVPLARAVDHGIHGGFGRQRPDRRISCCLLCPPYSDWLTEV